MTRLLLGLIWLYQRSLSHFLGGHCRYEPSCSHYALQALRQHGAAAGSRLTCQRLLRCHPWHTDFFFDPVPPIAPPQPGACRALLPLDPGA